MKFIFSKLSKIITIICLVSAIFNVYSLQTSSTTSTKVKTRTVSSSLNSAQGKSKFNSSNRSQASTGSTVKASSKSTTEMTSTAQTSNKALMEAFVRMKNLMKAHTESKYQSEQNQLDFMMVFENIGHTPSHPISHTNTESTPSNSFSFKAKETALASSSTAEKESLENTLRLNNNFSTKARTEAFSQSTDNPKKTKHSNLNDKDENVVVQPGEILEGWWRIKAKELKSTKKFPPLPLPKQKVLEISLNEKGFRRNFAFNCTDSKMAHQLDFWFRLSDIAMWYAATETDYNVLSSIDWDVVDDIVESQEKHHNTQLYCFETNDRQSKGWKMCTCDFVMYNKWMCRIKKRLGMPLPDMCDPTKPINPNNGTKEIVQIQPELIIPLPSRDCNENWKYKFNGKDWECICKEGFQQSPIDLPPTQGALDSPIKPLFQYKEVGPELELSTLDGFQREGANGQLRNFDGHLTLYNYDFGKIVLLDGSVYRAEEITFHTPSNHRIAGKQFPLEVSIIHYGITKGDIAKQVILSFLFEKKAGVYNQFLDDIDFMNLPNPTQRTRAVGNPVYIPKILFEAHGENDDQIVTMKPFSFYTYQGSLMFPPCTERTIHFVTSTPLRVGSTALQMFTEALKVPDMIESSGGSFDVVSNDEIPVSNRDTQPLNGRPVFHYDHKKYCPVEPEHPIVKPSGHYEKMPREATNVFFVSGNKPSGIPGAFVVPDQDAGKGK